MIEQIPLGRVAERIERAADADRGMVLDAGEVGLIAGLPGASERMRHAAGAGRAVRATSEEVAALMSDDVRGVARLMRLEEQHRAAAGKAHADLLLETGGVSTLDVVQSLEGNAWKYAKTMPDIPHWYCMMENWRGPVGYHVAMGVIRTRGVRKRWGPYFHPYLHANGWKYWVMATSWPVEEYPVPPEGGINRARDDDEGTAFDVLAGKLPELQEEHEAAAGLELRGAVLDIGVGEGWLTRCVPAHRYLGLEPSSPMLQSAAAQCPLHASRMLLCTLANFPYGAAVRYGGGGRDRLVPAARRLGEGLELGGPGRRPGGRVAEGEVADSGAAVRAASCSGADGALRVAGLRGDGRGETRNDSPSGNAGLNLTRQERVREWLTTTPCWRMWLAGSSPEPRTPRRKHWRIS